MPSTPSASPSLTVGHRARKVLTERRAEQAHRESVDSQESLDLRGQRELRARV